MENKEKEKKLSLYTIELSPEEINRLLEIIKSNNAGYFHYYDVAYSIFAYKSDKRVNKNEKVNIVAYKSGKLVISGKGTESFVQNIIEPQITGEVLLGYDEYNHPEWFELHAGCDESGKGDLFGPLVSACVIADGEMVREWLKMGINDSKKLSDKKIIELDKLIRNTKGVIFETFTLKMEKYNELMTKPNSNLNRLLAWYHGISLVNALKRSKKVKWGIVDQFTKQKGVIDRYLKDFPNFNLIYRTKAESDPVVAAASIIARAVYINEVKKLSEELGCELIKGASAAVLEQAKEVFKKFKKEGFNSFVKLHFKTAYEAQGLEAPKSKKFKK